MHIKFLQDNGKICVKSSAFFVLIIIFQQSHFKTVLQSQFKTVHQHDAQYPITIQSEFLKHIFGKTPHTFKYIKLDF